MGDFDFVPQTITTVGGTTVFHKLNQRPGKPLLGAIGPGGQLVMGLPGKIARSVTEKDIRYMRWLTTHYVELAERYTKEEDVRPTGETLPK